MPRSPQTFLFDLGPKVYSHGGAPVERGGATEAGGGEHKTNRDRSPPTTGRRKERRPISLKRPMHICLRASAARGPLSLRQASHYQAIATLLRRQSARHCVRLHSWVNVGNHLHLVLRTYRRESFQNFLRSFSCLSARAVTGARRGRPFGRRFWDHLAFSRILTSRREEVIMDDYLAANALETEHGHEAREGYLRERAKNRERRGAQRSGSGGLRDD